MADQITSPRYRFNPATQTYELLTPATQPVATQQTDVLSSLQGDSEGGFSPYRQIPGQDYGEYNSTTYSTPQQTVNNTSGIRSLPRYSYNPRTQRYTLLSAPTNPNVATQQNPIDVDGGGDGAGSAGGGSSGTGSGGAVGDIGLGLMGLSESVPGIATSALGVVGQAMADAAINSQAETDAALAQANQQAQESTVSMGPFGPTVSTTTSISPVADPAQVSVASIGPAESTTSIGEAVDAAEAEAAATDAANAADAADAADAGDGSAGDGDGSGDGGDGGDGGGDGGGGDGERAGGIISVMNRYAQGGMPDIARHVQSQGRGEDKVLVHMTPREVQGLQYLAMRHGGSLTINPNTGLVEAGFLSSLLPMLAGAALSATGIGAPMAALMVGGATGLATKSLSKGLMAGLGAFGGAGLAGSFGAAGAATAPASAGLSTAGELATSNIAPEAAQALSYGDKIGMSMQSPYFQAAQSNIDPGMLQGMTAEQVVNAPVLSSAPGTMPSPPTFGQGIQQMGRGVANVFGTGTEADAARAAFMQKVGGASGLAKTGTAALTSLAAADADRAPPPPLAQARIRPYRYDPGRQVVGPKTDTSESKYFAPRFTPLGVFKPGEEPTSYDAGGKVRQRINRSELDEDLYDFADFRNKRAMQAAGAKMFALGGGINMGGRVDEDYNENVDRNSAFSDDFYGGGLTALAAGGRPNKPRFLVGKGDGMSDSIPATINDVQPARLADGEFVVPADVVSHLGNGSSKAGAAKLHAMMDRIRKVRTGKQRQAPEVKAERYMPA